MPLKRKDGKTRVQAIQDAIKVPREECIDIRPPNSTDSFPYPRVYFKRKYYYAHRLTWQLAYGQIPKGLSVLHSCDHPWCINPKHLRLGTQAENMYDRMIRNRSFNKQKTHCKYGHSLDDAYLTLFESKSGEWRERRNCRTCVSIRNRGEWPPSH